MLYLAEEAAACMLESASLVYLADVADALPGRSSCCPAAACMLESASLVYLAEVAAALLLPAC